jgi:hypothetical protein
MHEKSFDSEPNLQRLAASLSGAAGQYFVAAEISRRGLIATNLG